jgi:hypothetical protein
MATLTVKRGDTWTWPFYLYSKAEDGSKTPIDLTDCSARLQVKPKRGDTPVLSATVSPDPADETINGEITLTPVDGLATVVFQPATTREIEPDKYVSDLEITWADGSVQSSMTFTVVVDEDVTT